MKTILLAAAATLSLVAASAAHAGEGNGDPFPFYAPGMTTAVPQTYAADTGSAAYPNLAGRPSSTVAADSPDAVPSNGSEEAVQTANSLPQRALEGTVAYAQAQSVRRYLAQQQTAAARTRVAKAVQVPGP